MIDAKRQRVARGLVMRRGRILVRGVAFLLLTTTSSLLLGDDPGALTKRPPSAPRSGETRPTFVGQQFSAGACEGCLKPDPGQHPMGPHTMPYVVQLFLTEDATVTPSSSGVHCTGIAVQEAGLTWLYTAGHCSVVPRANLPYHADPKTLRLAREGAQPATTDVSLGKGSLKRHPSFQDALAKYVWKNADFEWNISQIVFPDDKYNTGPVDLVKVDVTAAWPQGWKLRDVPRGDGSDLSKGITVLLVGGGCVSSSGNDCYQEEPEHPVYPALFALDEAPSGRRALLHPVESAETMPGDSGGPAFRPDAANAGATRGKFPWEGVICGHGIGGANRTVVQLLQPF